VQLFEAARRAHPSLLEDIGRGQFATLLGWLRQHVHRHGRKFLPKEIIKRATGTDLTPEPYLQYLRSKFSDVYGVTLEEPARRSHAVAEVSRRCSRRRSSCRLAA